MLIRRDEHNIDKLFRQKLHDVEEETPLHLWEGIRARSQRRRSRFLGFAFFAALVAGIIFLISSGSDERAQPIAENGNISATEKSAGNSEEAITVLDSEKNNSENRSSAEAVSPPGGSQESNKKSAIDAEQTSADKAVSKPKKEVARKTKTSNTPENSGKYSGNSGIPLPDYSANKASSVINGSSVRTTTVFGQPIPEPVQQISVVAPPSQIISYEDDPSTLPMSNGTYTQVEEEILDDAMSPISLAPPVFNLQQSKLSKWRVGVYAMATDPYHGASRGHNPQQIDALLSRTTTHTGTGLGAAVHYALQPQIYLSAGIETSSFKETHNWQDTTGYSGYFEQISYEETYPDPEGPPVIVMNVDTVFNEDIVYSNHKATNEYISVNVPLMLGWQKQFGKLTLGLEAGPVLRVQNSYRGFFMFARSDVNSNANITTTPPITDTSGTEIGQSMDNTEVRLDEYYTRWRTDLHIGINLNYEFAPRISVSAGLFYRQSAVIIDRGNPLAHRMVQPGARLAVFYNF